MSISPPSDIVLGVANAADPEKYRAAVAQLQRTGEGTAAAGAASTATGAQFTVSPIANSQTTAAAANAHAVQTGASSMSSLPVPNAATSASTTAGGSTDRELKAYRQFEAFLMQTFIETMLPKDASTVYGSGTAGDIWRSMLAEHTANELTKTSVLGIAESIMKAKTKQKKSLTTGTVQPNATSPAGLNASLSYLQSITGSNAQATAVAPSLTSTGSRSGS